MNKNIIRKNQKERGKENRKTKLKDKKENVKKTLLFQLFLY